MRKNSLCNTKGYLFFFTLLIAFTLLYPSSVLGIMPPPNAPSELTAAAISGNAVYLTWKDNSDANNNEAAFFIYRGEKSGGATTYLTSIKKDITEYIDTTVAANKTYFYAVRAYNDWGNSEFSEEANATTSPPYYKVITLKIGSPDMYVNGVKQQIDSGRKTSATVVNGRTLVPIRAIIEALGGEISWEGAEQKTTVKLKDQAVDLWIGKTKAIVNGNETKTDAAPAIVNGRTMLPLRFISENLGCQVKWDGNASRVTIIRQIDE